MTRDEALAALEQRAESPEFPLLLIPASPQVVTALLRGHFVSPSGKVMQMVGGRLNGIVFEPEFRIEEPEQGSI